jgi:putative addiction module component (TIGR02574 family)
LRYRFQMSAAANLLGEAMKLPDEEREELAAKLLDSLERPPGISIDDKDEILRRAADARAGLPGISWDEVKRSLVK